MGRWDGDGDREGYGRFLEWFDSQESFGVFREIGTVPDAWNVDGDILCPPCLGDELPYGSALAEPADPKRHVMCDRCRRPLNERGEALLSRAGDLVGAVEALGCGEGDTGSDDGPFDATGYAAIWCNDPAKEPCLFRLAAEHGFGIEGDNEWGYAEEGCRLFYFYPNGEAAGLAVGLTAMTEMYGWKGER